MDLPKRFMHASLHQRSGPSTYKPSAHAVAIGLPACMYVTKLHLPETQAPRTCCGAQQAYAPGCMRQNDMYTRHKSRTNAPDLRALCMPAQSSAYKQAETIIHMRAQGRLEGTLIRAVSEKVARKVLQEQISCY